jgi:hypothetical protein
LIHSNHLPQPLQPSPFNSLAIRSPYHMNITMCKLTFMSFLQILLTLGTPQHFRYMCIAVYISFTEVHIAKGFI